MSRGLIKMARKFHRREFSIQLKLSDDDAEWGIGSIKQKLRHRNRPEVSIFPTLTSILATQIKLTNVALFFLGYLYPVR